MRVLMVFSRYRQPGGEERSTETEADLLRAAGHQTLVHAIGSPLNVQRDLLRAVGAFEPDIVHIQNFFPFIQPRHYEAIRALGCPIVQSLRNYRLTCISANHWRDGRSCHDCSFEDHVPGVRHGCYRGHRATSAVAATLLSAHRRHETWTSNVSTFIAVSDHVRRSVEPFLGDASIVVKPNTVVTDHLGVGAAGNVVYVGRLSREKGVLELAETWARRRDLPELVLVGGGPQRASIEAIAEGAPNVRCEGQVEHDRALRLMGDAVATIAPWRWDEPFGRSLMESLAVGTPVLASPAAARNFPGMNGAIVQYDPEAPSSLEDGLRRIADDPQSYRDAAQHEFANRFSPRSNLETLMTAYELTLDGVGNT